jgi:hypothetical protein
MVAHEFERGLLDLLERGSSRALSPVGHGSATRGPIGG